MTLFAVCGFSAAAALLALLLREQKSHIGALIGAAAGVVLLAYLLTGYSDTLAAFLGFARQGAFSGYLRVLVKALGAAVLAECAADVCRDLGEASVAARVELAGRLEILAMSLPLINELLGTARELAV